MDYPTIPDDVKTRSPAPFLIASRDSLSRFVDGCPHAQTLTGYSLLLMADVVLSLGCNQWSCVYCSRVKIRRLAAKTRDAAPNRMLTLTINPSLWANPRAAFDGTRRQLPVLISHLREKFGQVEYLRCTELTSAGWPHYHLLIRSAYLPHAVVKAKWLELTGAPIVDVRTVKKHFKAYWYLVKYLSKLHKIEWTERHVSYSRGFFPEEKAPQKPDLDLQRKMIIECHPVTYLLDHFRGTRVTKLSPFLYKHEPLDPEKGDTQSGDTDNSF